MTQTRILLVSTVLVLPLVALAAGDLPTDFTRKDSIVNTRHNLSQTGEDTSIDGGVDEGQMNGSRNNYQEVCVYCHTPHGANKTLDAPLWNRTHVNNTYTTYDTLATSTLTEPVSAPGVNSLTCLSCHDGTVAIDSIINMPGSGLYQEAQEGSQDNDFLQTWTGAGPSTAEGHAKLAEDPGDPGFECQTCHNPLGDAGATDFTVFVIGTDLSDDHPVGIGYPESRVGDDFNEAAATRTGLRWYDGDGDAVPDKDEIRFYDTGEGAEVECASCHDPHGVEPSPGAEFNPTFLRVSNAGSALCQTCHAK